jgi:hypothetical protein
MGITLQYSLIFTLDMRDIDDFAGTVHDDENATSGVKTSSRDHMMPPEESLSSKP